MSKVKDLEKEQRSGEELDLQKLLPWIKKNIPTINDQPTVTQFSGGASNWTYRLKFEQDDIILRRAPLGKKAAGAHDMPREFHLQKKLKPHYQYVPEMLAVCEDESVLGSTFYLMERLEGIILRKNLPKEVNWDEATVQKICYSFWDKMIELHQVDYKKEGLEGLGKGEGYIERQILGWNKRYANAKTWNVPSGKKVMKWLEENMPKEEKLCVIHNDFRLDNVVLDPSDPSNVLGVLDWELAAIGDPLMDLGNSLAYWIEDNDTSFAKSMRRQPSNIPGMLTREEIITYYCQKTGREVDDFRFYRVYGLFRLAGIVQQIYYRYSKGYTKNKAFKNFWIASWYLIKTCENVIKQKNV
ncbi:aminoglycoside phosphotransferase [Aquimarina aggregata]|uniref:Aminoglycoside phosphotransferase n=1 Tax=Aquimarina aggregata TaxID=1642818 RepID=A0A163D4J6_9FLAO|nr:phosphotransferase family protein [Aquimarina aggregata]KZS42990.1 aminoglycoside phosphotransferase [Aquimarina aggregata]